MVNYIIFKSVIYIFHKCVIFQYKLFKLLNNISNNINITILMLFYVLFNNFKKLLFKLKEYFLITLFFTNSFF